MPYDTAPNVVYQAFQETITIQSDTIPPNAMPPDLCINAFLQILSDVINNPIGRFVVISILNELNEIKTKYPLRFNKLKVLCIRNNDTEQGFVRPVAFLKKPARIDFSVKPVGCSVIDQAQHKTVTKPAETDILLFHELLHWARYLNMY
jgi:hypothetical protein